MKTWQNVEQVSQLKRVPTKCDVAHVLPRKSIRSLQLLWWLCMAEEHLRSRLAPSTTFLELLGRQTTH